MLTQTVAVFTQGVYPWLRCLRRGVEVARRKVQGRKAHRAAPKVTYEYEKHRAAMKVE